MNSTNIDANEENTSRCNNDNLDFFDDLDFESWVFLTRATDIVVKAREMELSQFHLTKAQGEILHRLLNNERGLTIAEISQWNAKEQSSVLNLINRMEKNNLVKKSRINNRTNILITQKGRDAYFQTTRKSIEMIFSVLSEDEKKELIQISKKLLENTRKLLGINFKPPFLSADS